MSTQYFYYKLDTIPCRVEKRADGSKGEAEIYESGEGFVSGPKMEILFDGVPISKRECEAMIVRMREPYNA